MNSNYALSKSVFVIGEMASAHDGNLGKAKELVDLAVDAGCDAVKTQFWSNSDRLADRRKVPQYYRHIYHKYQIPVEWLRILKDYCADRIEFMATCFLPEDVETVSPFVKRFKVSSFESCAGDLLRAVYSIAKERPVIISINSMLDDYPSNLPYFLMSPDSGLIRRNVDVMMYCVSAYPAKLERIYLLPMSELHWYEEGYFGFSDHSGDLDLGAYAVCAGADVIEAHMKLINTDKSNPDGGSFAHAPVAFKQYVSNVRKAQLIMSANRLHLSKEEEAMATYRVVNE